MTTVEIQDDVEPKIVEEMLRYIYTGQIESIDQVSDKLILLSYKYVLPNLTKLCEATLLSSVTVKNAMEVYALGKEIMSSKLTSKAFTVMKM